jgi:endonuclease-3 related protein
MESLKNTATEKVKLKSDNRILLSIHRCLTDFFGPLYWWPGDSELEIMIGAILTQNTNWQNVSKAIKNLKENNLLDTKALVEIDEKILANLIKSCGYYNLKAKRLKNFIYFFYKEYDGSAEKMFSKDFWMLRKELLSINGIGTETADSILLYAGNKPIFVVDAYTKRVFRRHKIISEKDDYEQIQRYFMEKLPSDYQLYNEFHAQIVMVGKQYCKKSVPNCQDCPLAEFS